MNKQPHPASEFTPKVVANNLETTPSRFNPQMLVVAREAAGLTQSELAEAIGVTQSKISKLEDGLLPNLSDE